MKTESKVAVVTGSSSGIGRAIALQFAADGFDVIVHAGHNKTGAESVADEITNMGRDSTVVIQDFSDPDSLGGFVDSCWKWRDVINVWVNNAGADVLTGDSADENFGTKLSSVFQVDVVATILLSRDVGRRMRSRKSNHPDRFSIINMGWDQVNHGMAGDSGEMFAASKGAIMAFTRSLAQSLAPVVRVNCIAPGWIRTRWGQEASSRWQDRARHESLSNRWGEPEDIAGLAAFLASGQADFVNGQVICANGGFRMTGNGDSDSEK